MRFECLDSKCKKPNYLNPKVGVALLIEYKDTGKLILVQRKVPPSKDAWTLPSGYVEYDEACEAAAIREASEEISVKVELKSLKLDGVYSFGDDPRSRMVLVVYTAPPTFEEPKAADDAKAWGYFSPAEIIAKDIAFAGNKLAISKWAKSKESC